MRVAGSAADVVWAFWPLRFCVTDLKSMGRLNNSVCKHRRQDRSVVAQTTLKASVLNIYISSMFYLYVPFQKRRNDVM